MQFSIFVTMTCDPLAIDIENLPFSSLHFASFLPFGANDTIPKVVIRIIHVLFDVLPAAAHFLAIHREQLLPGIRATEKRFASQHRRKRSEGHSIAAITSRHKLPLGRFANVWQAIMSLDTLARPAPVELRRGDVIEQHSL